MKTEKMLSKLIKNEMKEKKLLLELIDKKVSFYEFYKSINININYDYFAISSFVTPIFCLLLDDFKILIDFDNKLVYSILIMIVFGWILLSILFFLERQFNKKNLYHKMKNKKVKSSTEALIFLLDELSSEELISNLDKIIYYISYNQVRFNGREYKINLHEYLINRKDISDINNIIFNNKYLLLNSLNYKKEKERIDYFFSEDFQQKLKNKYDLKFRLEIEKSVLIGDKDNFISWYIDNIDEHYNKVLYFLNEINYVGEKLYLLKEAIKEKEENSNNLLKDINNNLVYKF